MQLHGSQCCSTTSGQVLRCSSLPLIHLFKVGKGVSDPQIKINTWSSNRVDPILPRCSAMSSAESPRRRPSSSGVSPESFLAWMSAPQATSNDEILVCFWLIDSCSGVHCRSPRLLTSPPSCSSTITISRSPLLAARCNGVQPCKSCCDTGLPDLISDNVNMTSFCNNSPKDDAFNELGPSLCKIALAQSQLPDAIASSTGKIDLPFQNSCISFENRFLFPFARFSSALASLRALISS